VTWRISDRAGQLSNLTSSRPKPLLRYTTTKGLK
jgi:hypothetical protein